MIFELFTVITIILVVNIIIFRGNFCCPSILFTAGFWIASLWAWCYQERWGGFQNTMLFVLVLTGIFAFSLGCVVIRLLSYIYRPNVTRNKLKRIKVSQNKLYIYLGIEMIIAILTVYVVLQNVSSKNLFIAIGQYYNASKYNYLVYEPGYLKVMQYFNIAGVFIFGYIVINNWVCEVKNQKIIYLIISFGMGISLLQGIRNTFFLFIISGIVMFYLLRGTNNGWKSNFSLSTIPKLLFFIILIIILFQITTIATGRTSDEFSFVEMLSTYVGSPLKNLELYLSDNHRESSIWGGQTFAQMYKKLYEHTGNVKYKVFSLYTYRWIGNTGLGNVYTILMPLYQDFGLLGTGIVLFIVGGLSQWIYDRIQRIVSIHGFNYWILIYSYISFSISFSFFSNKYFEMVISVAFIYTFISICVIKVLIFNVDLYKGKLIVHKQKKSDI